MDKRRFYSQFLRLISDLEAGHISEGEVEIAINQKIIKVAVRVDVTRDGRRLFICEEIEETA
jgi:hypothetical protein